MTRPALLQTKPGVVIPANAGLNRKKIRVSACAIEVHPLPEGVGRGEGEGDVEN